jgi:hypothetical protein
MNREKLIKCATGRLEAMGEAIDGCFELLNGIYAERQLVSYLLWLSGGNEEKENLE